MKRGVVGLLVGVFLATLLGLLAYTLSHRPRVLIVHSYEQDFAWVRDIDAGVARTFRAGRLQMEVKRHYLDMNAPHPPASREVLRSDVERAIAMMRPQVLIAFDDEAQAQIAARFAGRSDIAVVFAGVDETPERYGYAPPAANVTGVLERLPLAAMRDLLDIVGGGRPLRVAVLGDGDPTSRAEAAQIAAFDWAAHRLVADRQPTDFAAWRAAVAELDGMADVLLITGHRRLAREAGSSERVSPAEVVAWTEANARALPLAGKTSFVRDGGALSVFSSGREHGEAAAAMALAVVNGASPADLPVRTGTDFIVGMSLSRLERRGIRLPAIYQSSARATGTFMP